MRALAVWGVCPDTGPACFSGRNCPSTCGKNWQSGHKRPARSSLQQPGPSKEPRSQPLRSEGPTAAVASLDWEGDWEDFNSSSPPSSRQDQNQPWDQGFFAPVQQSAQEKPLKINRDLLLVSRSHIFVIAQHLSLPSTRPSLCCSTGQGYHAMQHFVPAVAKKRPESRRMLKLTCDEC